MDDATDRETFVKQVVDDSLAPYAELLPAHALDEMQALLSLVLDTHPVGATLVDRARPRKAPEQSGEQPKDGADVPADLAKAGTDER